MGLGLGLWVWIWWKWVLLLVLDLDSKLGHGGLHLGHGLPEGFNRAFKIFHCFRAFFGISSKSAVFWIVGSRYPRDLGG